MTDPEVARIDLMVRLMAADRALSDALNKISDVALLIPERDRLLPIVQTVRTMIVELKQQREAIR
jgi:hypothetical protein